MYSLDNLEVGSMVSKVVCTCIAAKFIFKVLGDEDDLNEVIAELDSPLIPDIGDYYMYNEVEYMTESLVKLPDDYDDSPYHKIAVYLKPLNND